MSDRELILSDLQPMFEEARRTKMWFWCNYQDLWFSPDELSKLQDEGRFVWGIVNWRLRDPQEYIDEARRRALEAELELSRRKSKVNEYFEKATITSS